MLAPSMCCGIILEGERQSSGYGETRIQTNSCATVIKFTVFSEVGVERRPFWRCLSGLPSLWKFSKKFFPMYRCPVIVVIDVYLLLTSTLIRDLVVAIISIMSMEHLEGKKASGLQPVKI